jgi:hypothetical protein
LEHREIEPAPVEWRGSIEHMASGRTKYLTDLDEIAQFVRPHLEAMGVSFRDPEEHHLGITSPEGTRHY